MERQLAVVAKTTDLTDGEMIEVTVGDTDLVLVRLDGAFYAIDAHCSHYGGRLVDGVLERQSKSLVCPLHHAVFDLETGEDVEPPARDCLNSYPVATEGDDVVVEIPDEPDRAYSYASRDRQDERHFVILGAGAAASMAAETLRRNDYRGRLTLVTPEEDFPYDRPNLSKDYLAGVAEPEWIPLRDESFYDDHDIDVRTKSRAVGIDPEEREVELAKGDRLEYDKLLVATGATPIRPEVPGVGLDGVQLLRTLDDAETIIERLDGVERAVVVGSGFIGMEAAFSLRERDIDVTVTSLDSTPFEQTFGPQVGRAVRRLHETHGVGFELDRRLEAFEGGRDDTLDVVALDDGPRLEVDLAVVGIGVRPATDFIDDFELADDGSLPVDRHLQVADDVFAAGDVARFPDPRTLRPIRVEHWRLANQHGKVAALNMLGDEVEYDEVPFFWTRQFDTAYKYVGHADQWEDVLIDGELADNDFIAYYIDGDDVLAACGTRGDQLSYVHALMRHDAMPPAHEVLGGF